MSPRPSPFRAALRVPSRTRTILAVGFSIGILVASASRAGNWPQFRGENGSGVAEDHRDLVQWNADSIRWTVELPGVGHSAPVIWGDRLFLTSATNEGKTRLLLCLNAETGKPIWTRTFEFQSNRKHRKSSWASSTPAVDGERVYSVFADVEHYVLYAHDFQGKELWQQSLGRFESQHGQGVSPIVFEDLVILPNDQDGPSTINAWNKRTGHPVWSVPRASGAQATSYATPLIYRPKGAPPQLICSSSKSGVCGLDPRTGRSIWNTDPFPQRTVGSPVLAGGLIFQTCGAAGQGVLMVAIDPSGTGDVSKSHVRYERKKLLPYVPTPVAYGNYLFLWGDHGIVCCVDPRTGQDVWRKRIGSDFSGSPICAGGLLFNMSEQGTVFVLEAGSEFKSFGEIPLGDPSHSTPAAANGRVYFRTFHRLACASARP